MASKMLRLARLVIRESFNAPGFERQPEPSTEMDNARNVEAFHRQGAATGPLLPVYHFNALATSRLAPKGGLVVDLGSGSGQYLAYLARRRPDLRIIGLDLAPTMVEVGNRFLEAEGLDGQVELRIGDMTQFAATIDGPAAVVSSVFSLHHLPTWEHLQRCLEEIARLRERSAAAVWIFDHARPRHPATAEVFPEIFTPEAPPAFRADSRNSLLASFGCDELSNALDEALTTAVEHYCARFMRLYQVHRLCGPEPRDGHRYWVDNPLPREAKRDFQGLAATLFPRVL